MRKEEVERRKEKGERRKEKGGRRKEEGGRRKEGASWKCPQCVSTDVHPYIFIH